MVRGPKKHLKRLNAPKHWMLDKLGGTWAPKPSAGPHKSRECLPLILLLRNRLRYALTRREVVMILKQRLVKVDGKIRTDSTYPSGFMDVIQIQKTNEYFRLLYDVKGRFIAHRISPEEAKFKLCKVTKTYTGRKGIPTLSTNDGRTFRYPNPSISKYDSIKLDLSTGKIVDFIRFDVGNLCYVTGGRNLGRIGIIERREKHDGGFDIVHVKDVVGHKFSTRLSNIFVIGKGTTSLITIPRTKGVRISILQDRLRRLRKHKANAPKK